MELHFNMFKIRYEKLDELVKDITFIPGEEINIFINIDCIIKKIKNSIEDREQIITDSRRNIILSSCIFNLVAHYRNYFNKKQVCSKVYVYGPSRGNIDKQDYYNSEYNENYRKKGYMSEMTDTSSIGNVYGYSMHVIKNLLDYVDGVYFIPSRYIEPSVVPLVIHHNCDLDGNKNFLVSDDKYEMQYCLENFYILKPRLDKSIMISKDNVMDILKEKTKCVGVENPPINFIPFILSILGDEYRGIDKIKKFGISNIYKAINKGIELNIVNDQVETITSLVQVMDETLHDEILKNFLCTSIYEQEKRINYTDKSILLNMLINKYDGGYLREVNDEYFIECPLDIININKGIKKRKFKVNWR